MSEKYDHSHDNSKYEFAGKQLPEVPTDGIGKEILDFLYQKIAEGKTTAEDISLAILHLAEVVEDRFAPLSSDETILDIAGGSRVKDEAEYSFSDEVIGTPMSTEETIGYNPIFDSTGILTDRIAQQGGIFIPGIPAKLEPLNLEAIEEQVDELDID